MLWAFWLIAPVIEVAFAVAFHYGVDMPTQRWIKRRRAKGASAPRGGDMELVGAH